MKLKETPIETAKLRVDHKHLEAAFAACDQGTATRNYCSLCVLGQAAREAGYEEPQVMWQQIATNQKFLVPTPESVSLYGLLMDLFDHQDRERLTSILPITLEFIVA